jgi:hypothetical protein
MVDPAGSARILSQVVNSYNGVKRGFQEKKTWLYKAIQKTGDNGPMSGIHRVYTKRDDDGADLPEEYRRVQYTAESQLEEFLDAFVRLADVQSTMDVANTVAKADVKIGETVIIEGAPPTQLLALEKQIIDLRTFIASLPILDPATTWTWNADAGAYASRPTGTTKTEKITVPVVMSPATEKHPAQIMATNKDEIIGYWNTVRYSGHMDGDAVKRLLDRCDTLLLAVKYAREEANAQTTVDHVRVGGAIRTYLMGE